MQEHVLVIGGTRGLGKVVVNLMQGEGYQVSVLARNLPATPIADVNYFTADLKQESSYLPVIHTIAEAKPIHHLIFLQRFRGEGDTWTGELAVGLEATKKIIDDLTQHFAKGNNLSITLVSSVAGQFANHTQPLSYLIVKAGINYMIKYYAVQLGNKGIRVNGVSPIGFVKEETRQFYYEDNKPLSEMYETIVPLQRMCTTHEIANVIAFLCSKNASYLSAQNIVVDGGLSAIAHETLAASLSGL